MIRAALRFLLRAEASFYAARASWQESKRATIDPQVGIESAVRYSELTDKAHRDRKFAEELRHLADEMSRSKPLSQEK